MPWLLVGYRSHRDVRVQKLKTAENKEHSRAGPNNCSITRMSRERFPGVRSGGG